MLQTEQQLEQKFLQIRNSLLPRLMNGILRAK